MRLLLLELLFYLTVLMPHVRVMRIQQETTSCEHEPHQSLINNELMTVMGCRICRENGERNCPELRIQSLFQGHEQGKHTVAEEHSLNWSIKMFFLLLLLFLCFELISTAAHVACVYSSTLKWTWFEGRRLQIASGSLQLQISCMFPLLSIKNNSMKSEILCFNRSTQ